MELSTLTCMKLPQELKADAPFLQFEGVPGYLDFSWDTMDRPSRDALALGQAKATALFALTHVPFYKHHYSHLSENNISDISSLEEFTCIIPEITKYHLSINHCRAFLPDIAESERDPNKGCYRNKGTGGTTGNPVTILYSPQDWRAMAQHIARSIKYDFRDNPEYLKDLLVLGLYHGDHVTNEIYQAGFNLLGIEFLDRASTKKDLSANYHHFQRLRATAILAPPEDPAEQQTKGITLDKFLQFDARNGNRSAIRLNHKINPDFLAIFWSSMPMSGDLQDYIINHLKVPYQQAQYGSTEVCPTGATCSTYPRDFHLGYGPTLVQVKSADAQRLVRDGEEGYVVVSKTGAASEHGTPMVPTGTCIINYRTGDGASLIKTDGERCGCGRTTPVLYQVHRREYIETKRVFGCQAD